MTGFQSPYLSVRSSDGLNFTLLEPVTYIANNGTVIMLGMGCKSNGASTPQIGWDVLPPFSQYYWKAAFLHDCLYSNTALIKQSDGTFRPANLSKDDCDSLLYEAMTSLGCQQETMAAIYKAVAIFGQPYFDAARATPQNTGPLA